MMSFISRFAEWDLLALFLFPSLILVSGLLTPRKLRWLVIILTASAFLSALWLQSIIAEYGLSRAIVDLLFYLRSLLGQLLDFIEQFVNALLAIVGSSPISLQGYLPPPPRSGSLGVLSARETWLFSSVFLLLYFAIRLGLYFVYLIIKLIFVLLKAAVLILKWIWTLPFGGTKQAPASGRIASRADTIFDLPPSCGFLRPTLAVTACAVGIGITLPLIANLSAGADAFYGHFFWPGVWILLVEAVPMARAATALSEARSVTAIGAGAREVSATPDSLFEMYVQKHNDLILHADKYPQLEVVDSGQVFSTEIRGDVLLVRIQERLQHLFPGDSASVQQAVDLAQALIETRDDQEHGNILLSESLSQSHFIFIAELIQHFQAQSELVLLVCPDGLEEDIAAALRAQQDPLEAALSQRWLVYGSQPIASDSRIGFLLCSELRLNDLLNELETDTSELRRLRLLIFVNFHELNGVLLRYQLTRVWRRVPRERVSVLFQSETRYQLESRVESILGRKINREMVWSPDVHATRYLLVWDGSPATRNRLSKFYYGKEGLIADLHFTIPYLAWSEDMDSLFYDPNNEFDHQHWETLRNVVTLAGVKAPQTWQRLWQFRVSRFLHGEGQEEIFVVNERASLPRAVRRNYNFAHRPSAMIHVVAWPYLMREWHLHHLKLGGTVALRRLQPLATQPTGGLFELAKRVEAALIERSHTRKELVETLRSIRSQQLVAFGIAPDLVGLRALLEVLQSDVRPVRFRGDSWQDRRYDLGATARPLQTYFNVFPEGHDKPYRLRLSRRDHGLTYAEGQMLLNEGRVFELIEVSDRVIVRTIEPDPDESRLTYQFTRLYRLPFTGREDQPRWLVEAGHPSEYPGGGKIVTTIFNGPIERTTKGYLQYREGSRPLAGENADFQYRPLVTPILTNISYASVCRMQFEGVAFANTEARRRIAFTMCSVLQDMLVSLFPDDHRRVAVLSPQAHRLAPESEHQDTQEERVEHFIRAYYPILVQNEPRVPPDPGSDIMELFVIEDSELDLGVVHAITINNEGIRRQMREFLSWAATQPASSLYHSFGADTLDPAFDYPMTLQYLTNFTSNELDSSSESDSKVSSDRPPKREVVSSVIQRLTKLCDFCGGFIGTPHYILRDGRKQCRRCHESALTAENFKAVLRDTTLAMQRRYGIELPGDISIECVDAGTIAEYLGQSFTPEAGMTPRTVGLAVQTQDGNKTIFVENGAPRLATVATLIHELTHIWQFSLPLAGALPGKEIIEGQAVTAEIDFINSLRAYALTWSLRAHYFARTDEYGRGYRTVSSRVRREGRPLFETFKIMLNEHR